MSRKRTPFDLRRVHKGALAGLVVATSWSIAGPSQAASKSECVEAFSEGQDARESGQLMDAREAFLTCAQSSCPELVQADCSRFGDELDRLIPSVVFAARGASSGDLPDTMVFVDGELAASRLSEGKTYEFDPGEHQIRFVHGNREATLRVVLNEGEKARPVVALFATDGDPSKPSNASFASPAPWVVAGLGATAMATGGVLMLVGLHDLPGDCSLSSRQCEAAPGDPTFNRAHAAVSHVDTGIVVGGVGAAFLAAGLVWALLPGPAPAKEATARATVQPWMGPRSGGMVFAGPL
jgi:hypothetical protein